MLNQFSFLESSQENIETKVSDTTGTYVNDDLPVPERGHRGEGNRGLVKIERGTPGSAWAACYKLTPCREGGRQLVSCSSFSVRIQNGPYLPHVNHWGVLLNLIGCY